MTAFDDFLAEQVDTLSGDFVPAVLSAQVTAKIIKDDPDMLDEWLREHAQTFVTDAIARRLSSYRARAAHSAKAREFADSTEDVERLSQFAVMHVIAEDMTRRRVADMTGDDHKYLAANYGATGRYDLMCEAFHLAVARKVGKKRTADVMSEEQYAALLAQMTSPKAALKVA